MTAGTAADRIRIIIFSILALAAVLCPPSFAAEREVIEITSPGRRLPVAFQTLTGRFGPQLSSIIRDDLDFAGLFDLIPENLFIEDAASPFNRLNWNILGADAVIKGSTEYDEKSGRLTATVFLFDTLDGSALVRKKYTAEGLDVLRTLSHTIANDIYKALTGAEGVFLSKIAFVGEEEGRKWLYVMDYDGGRPRRLGITGDLMLGPRWSPDGGRLMYSAQRGGQWGIYILTLPTMTEKLLYVSESTLIAGDFFPDGKRVVLSSTVRGTSDIYSYEIGNGRLQKIIGTRAIEVSPTVSPDGEKIAFVSDSDGEPHIYTMAKNGYNVKRVTFEGKYNTSPVWSSSGERLAYTGMSDGKNRICTVSPDGEGFRRLTEKGNNEDPSFSPDGRFIVFTSDRDGRKGVYLMRADGGGQRKISPAGLRASMPRWSPARD